MDNSEAELYLGSLISLAYTEQMHSAVIAGMEALKMRTPKAVERDGRYVWCPSCEYGVHQDTDRFCPYCGQKLLWEDKNE